MSDAGVLVALLAAATVRGAAPLVLAALGGLFSERSGVVDIGLEGKMLASAFAAAATAAVTGSAWIGLGAGIAASVLVGLVHGFACVTHQGNQVVSKVARRRSSAAARASAPSPCLGPPPSHPSRESAWSTVRS